nr:MAG TPA: hypothetical protein [Caudoviricetes sp.]
MLRQQKPDVCRAVPASGAPILHRAQRDARALRKRGLRHSGAGDHLPHGQVRQIPDDGQPLLFGVQINVAGSIVRDAEGDAVEERCPGCFLVGSHIKKFSTCIHS